MLRWRRHIDGMPAWSQDPCETDQNHTHTQRSSFAHRTNTSLFIKTHSTGVTPARFANHTNVTAKAAITDVYRLQTQTRQPKPLCVTAVCRWVITQLHLDSPKSLDPDHHPRSIGINGVGAQQAHSFSSSSPSTLESDGSTAILIPISAVTQGHPAEMARVSQRQQTPIEPFSRPQPSFTSSCAA